MVWSMSIPSLLQRFLENVRIPSSISFISSSYSARRVMHSSPSPGDMPKSPVPTFIPVTVTATIPSAYLCMSSSALSTIRDRIPAGFFPSSGVLAWEVLPVRVILSPSEAGWVSPLLLYHTFFRISAQIVKGVYLRNSLFPNQVFADLCSLAGLLAGLEDQIHRLVRLHPVQLQSQSTESSTVPVMTTFVRYALMAGMIRQRMPFLYGQGIHVSPKGYSPILVFPLLYGIKPPGTGYKFQTRVFPEEMHKLIHGLPKQLFTLETFKKLSSDAKILYALMLDRVSLSIKND